MHGNTEYSKLVKDAILALDGISQQMDHIAERRRVLENDLRRALFESPIDSFLWNSQESFRAKIFGPSLYSTKGLNALELAHLKMRDTELIEFRTVWPDNAPATDAVKLLIASGEWHPTPMLVMGDRPIRTWKMRLTEEQASRGDAASIAASLKSHASRFFGTANVLVYEIISYAMYDLREQLPAGEFVQYRAEPIID